MSAFPPFIRILVSRRAATVIGLAVLCLVVRVVDVDRFPLFVDEATYLEWAYRFQEGESGWMSLDAGKQPLLPWLGAAPLRLGADPLITVRVLSALLALAGLALAWRIGRRFLGDAALTVVLALYAVAPYLVLHQRLFLYEGLLDVAFLGAMLFALRYLEGFRHRDLAMLCAWTTVAVWTKMTSYALIVGLLLATAHTLGRRFLVDRRLWEVVLAVAVIPLTSTLLFVLEGDGPFDVQGPDGTFIRPGDEIAARPWRFLVDNVAALVGYWWILIGPAAALLMIGGLVLGGWASRSPDERRLLQMSVVPWVLGATVVAANSPRYYSFLVAPAMMLAAAPIERGMRAASRYVPRSALVAGGVAAVAATIAPPAFQTARLIRDYPTMRYPDETYQAMVVGWSASPDFGRLRSTIEDLAADRRDVRLWTDGTPGWPGAFIPWLTHRWPVFEVLPPYPERAPEADFVLVQGTLEGYRSRAPAPLEWADDLVLVARVRRPGRDPGCAPIDCAPDGRLPTSLYSRREIVPATFTPRVS